MNTAVLSLLVLAAVVVLGLVKKINLGFLSVGVAFVLGTAGGLSAGEIAAGFDSSMFVTLLGVTFLFGMASENGTLDLFSKKAVALVGRRTAFIPALLFFLSALIAAMGPGHIAAGILMTTFAMMLSLRMEINPVSAALYAKLGANAGGTSMLALAGVLALRLAEPLGYSGFEWHLFLKAMGSGFLFAMCVALGSGRAPAAENPVRMAELPAFNGRQRMTIAAIVLMVVCCIGLHLDTGLSAFVAAGVLILLGCADEKKAISAVPWGTLVLICGVRTLVDVVKTLGGIGLIASLLTDLMTERTAAPIFAAMSGVFSWVSPTTGVVMPTMFPIAADVAEAFASVSFTELVCAGVSASFAAAISPLSTGGAIILSAYTMSEKRSEAQVNRLFRILFLLSAANVGLNVLLAAVGYFGIGV